MGGQGNGREGSGESLSSVDPLLIFDLFFFLVSGRWKLTVTSDSP